MAGKKIGDWQKARRLLPQVDRAYRVALMEAVEQEAQYFVRKVKTCFKTSGKSNGAKWAPNSPLTIGRKGSSKPLINSGDLMGAITVKKVAPRVFLAGVPSNVRTKDGKSMVSIGQVHEEGRVIVMKITPKMHRFVMASLNKLGGKKGGGTGAFRPGGTLVIKIPQRSFLQSTKDAHFQDSATERRVKNRISMKLRTQFGNLVEVK